jgi:quercetin dioxygenase-like cupin family protein
MKAGLQSRRGYALLMAIALMGCTLFLPRPALTADAKFVVKPIAEKKVSALPAGPLYWRIENYPNLAQAQAQAAAGPTSLAAEVSGKAWLFILGDKGGSTPGGTKIAEIGPIPRITAPEYLLRINHASGPPGAKTAIHTHPGSEAFYVLAGRLGQVTPHGTAYAGAGETMAGHGADTPMEVFSAGSTDLDQIVLFLVDATKPFSTAAKLH